MISITAILISILMPALSRARQISNRTVCSSNLRQIGQAFLHYAQNHEGGWLPAKPHPQPNREYVSIEELATVQHRPSPEWGPNFSGMIRDIVERRHTREGRPYPLYLPEPKVLLCPSDKLNNRPGMDEPFWPTAKVEHYADLPRSIPEEATKGRSFVSYFYVALWRTDDRGDFILMADQSNHNDTTIRSWTGLTSEDNHGTRGMNVMTVDTHVEWTPIRSGRFEDVQQAANRYWGPIVVARNRYPGTSSGHRNSEVQTIE